MTPSLVRKGLRDIADDSPGSRMRKLSLVLIESAAFNYADAFERAFGELNIEVETVRIPFFFVQELTANKLQEIKNEICARKELGQFVLFFPGSAEILLKEPNWSFVCSHYRSWYDPQNVTVIPHLWTNIKSPASIESLKWTGKPPLRIGFMGTAYFNSRMASVSSKLPMFVKEWLLRGNLLKHTEILARLNQFGFPLKHINTFARSETLRTLHTKRQNVKMSNVEITDTKGFTGSQHDKDRYVKHLEAMTYVICPRGIENFSIRTYEALKYGRIPVIIDTDMVLPTEIDWNQVAIRIPYNRLKDISEIIDDDYLSQSAKQFLMRQDATFSMMAELEKMHWLSARLRQVAAKIETS